jgi:hypothetical protein
MPKKRGKKIFLKKVEKMFGTLKLPRIFVGQ